MDRASNYKMPSCSGYTPTDPTSPKFDPAMTKFDPAIIKTAWTDAILEKIADTHDNSSLYSSEFRTA